MAVMLVGGLGIFGAFIFLPASAGALGIAGAAFLAGQALGRPGGPLRGLWGLRGGLRAAFRGDPLQFVAVACGGLPVCLLQLSQLGFYCGQLIFKCGGFCDTVSHSRHTHAGCRGSGVHGDNSLPGACTYRAGGQKQDGGGHLQSCTSDSVASGGGSTSGAASVEASPSIFTI